MSIVLTTTITIDATTDEVWQVLTDFASYGQWSNFSRVDGVAETGTPLAMKMPGFSFTSTVTAVAPAEALQWSASILSDRLFLGQHTFALSANDDGTTQVTNTESFSGALVWPFKPFFATGGKKDGQKDNGYDRFNAALKQRVESIAARTAPTAH